MAYVCQVVSVGMEEPYAIQRACQRTWSTPTTARESWTTDKPETNGRGQAGLSAYFDFVRCYLPPPACRCRRVFALLPLVFVV